MQFSALSKQYWRKCQPSIISKLLGGAKKLMSCTFFVKFRVFKREFLLDHWVHWAQIFRDNWNCYALSIFRGFILLASPDNNEHNYVHEAENVNKDSPIHFTWGWCNSLQNWIFQNPSWLLNCRRALSIIIIFPFLTIPYTCIRGQWWWVYHWSPFFFRECSKQLK